MTHAAIRTLLLSLLPVPGCVLDQPVGGSTASLETDEVGLLAFVNDQELATFEVLDDDCAIRSDSARLIIKHRDGRDQTPFTDDDDLFDSLEELDGVKMVGPWTLDRLAECAAGFGYGSALWVLEAGDVAGVVDDGAALAGLDGYVQGICDMVVGESIGCMPRCLSMVSRAADEWLTEQVSGWVGQSFASRDEAVQAAADLINYSADHESDCWSYPECQGVNAMIACFESD